jgi:Ion transport protein
MNERAYRLTSRLDRVVLAVIAANAVVLVGGLVVDGHEQVFDTIHDAIVAFFLAELLVRLRAGGWVFLRGGWNCFDALVILASLLPIFGAGASMLRIARAARLLHLMRHLPHLRVDPFLKWPARLGPASLWCWLRHARAQRGSESTLHGAVRSKRSTFAHALGWGPRSPTGRCRSLCNWEPRGPAPGMAMSVPEGTLRMGRSRLAASAPAGRWTAGHGR